MTYLAKPFLQYARDIGINAQDLPTNVDVAFDVMDEDEGITGKIDDDEIYLPFSFEDLRQPGKILYFRAFIKEGFSETFTPEWHEEKYYGRTEGVPIYMGTMRTINISFDVVAWSPKDLSVLYKKLQTLQSMVYAMYDGQGFLKTGPICRMRVGDLIAAEDGQGLAGYMTALDFSYDKSIWNINTDEKVPRNITVSVGYTVLHESNPGLYKNEDGELKFGTATIEKDGEEFKVKNISESNIRKIFGQVRNGK